MTYKKINYLLASFVVTSSLTVSAEWSGKLTHESSFFTDKGTTIGADSATLNGIWSNSPRPNEKGDYLKAETSLRLYVDDEMDVGEGVKAPYHVELNLMSDEKGVTTHDGNQFYTQRDPLREMYVDTQKDDWALRIGKQQVVWGAADGVKFLDLINPTDYSEMAQNQMEDSRITTLMINAEKINDDGSSFQFVVSEPRENIFAGLDRNVHTRIRANNQTTFADETHDGLSQGHPFMLKGPDTITGYKNGFVNIVPDLGGVAGRFAGGFGGIGELSSAKMAGFTVSLFEGLTMDGMAQAMQSNAMLCTTCTVSGSVVNTDFDASSITYADLPDAFQTAVEGVSANFLSDKAEGTVTGEEMLRYGFAPYYNTTLENYSTSAADSVFDHMGSTTFRTFDTFVNARSQYIYDMPEFYDVNLAARYNDTLADGTNYSIVGSYNYDQNPIIRLGWYNDSGEKLTQGGNSSYITLTDAAGNAYGGNAGRSPILRFTETVERAINLGGSFSKNIDTEQLGPIVLRGEALYQKDVYNPVMDKTKLGYGDLVGALEMVKGDRLKYVLGVDVTALTNMMVSLQFIQDRNLDFIDGAKSNGRYTADYATMNLSNGFNKAIENKEFYSLYLSKPFGSSGQHRWNNIFMYEENDGNWNRFDVEYAIDDNTVGTFEWNEYFGDENTQFGQLKASSNLQLGVKYTF